MAKSVEDVVNSLKTTYRICEFLEFESTEDRALAVITGLIEQNVDDGQYTDKRDNKRGKTALHYAVERQFLDVCDVLIRHGMSTLQLDETPRQTRPVTIAVHQLNDDKLAELLVRNTDNSEVRKLMTRQDDTEPEISLHELLQKNNGKSMPKTVIALLDCLYEEWRVRGKCKLYYDVLETDENGNPPQKYEEQSQSALSIMVNNKQKDFLQHIVVRELVKRKWQLYGRSRYIVSFITYMSTFVSLTIAMALSVYATDVLVYNTPMDKARLAFEIVSYVCVCLSLFLEFCQLVRERCKYFTHDKYNIFESLSAVLLFAALPVRLTHVDRHWYLFSVGYLFWVLRVFKYANLYRRMATYVDCLWQLVIKVFPQFALLFIVMNLAFGGALVLGLKGDQAMNSSNETSSNETSINEPRSFHFILLYGTRTLTSGEPMFKDVGYREFSTSILLFFLFMIIIVLLSILIAQLNDALPIAKKKVDRNLTYRMARIIDGIESEKCHISYNLFCRCFLKMRCKGNAASHQAREYTPHDVIDIAKSKSANRQYCYVIAQPWPYAPSGPPSPRTSAGTNAAPSLLPVQRSSAGTNAAPSGQIVYRACVNPNDIELV